MGALAVGKTSGNHRAFESITLADAHPAVVEKGAITLARGEQFIAKGIEYDAMGWLASFDERNGHTAVRDAPQVVVSAIQRVNDPRGPTLANLPGFLGEDAMVGIGAVDLAYDFSFGESINFAGEIHALLLDDGKALDAILVAQDDVAGGACGAYRNRDGGSGHGQIGNCKERGRSGCSPGIMPATARARGDRVMSNVQANVLCVLVRPQHPGNIGAAARALRTMGLTRMSLVSPRHFPDADATALAAGADALLETAAVHADLDTALAGCTLALGLSARRRGVVMEEHDPRTAAARANAHAASGGQVALLFGNERTGLDNDELARCQAMVRIPSVDDFSSLNLAQAVQVMAYELRMSALAPSDAPPLPGIDNADLPAKLADLESFFNHLWQALVAIDFHKGRAPFTIERRLRRLFLRAQPSVRELRILHGVLSDAERMARLARAAERD